MDTAWNLHTKYEQWPSISELMAQTDGQQHNDLVTYGSWDTLWEQHHYSLIHLAQNRSFHNSL